MKKLYMDWGRRKPHMVIRPGNPGKIFSPEEMTTTEIVSLEPHKIYLEKGYPYYYKHRLLEAEHKLFQIDGKITKEERETLGLEKTDENDAFIIGILEQSQPKLFNKLIQKDKQSLLLQYLVGQLNKYTRECARLKNINHSLEEEFNVQDNSLKWAIDYFEEKKEKLLNPIMQLTWEATELIKVKRIGTILIANIMAWANPSDFPCLTKYLLTIGYKGIYKKNKKGKLVKMKKACRGKAKTVYWQCVDQFVKGRVSPWREMYDENKEKFGRENPDWRKGKVDGVTRNRVATQFAKYIYKLFHKNKLLKTSSLETEF